MRVGAKPLTRLGDADLGQELNDLCRRHCSAPMVERDDLADLPLDRMQRIERRHRLLKHHGDGVPTHRAQFVDRHFEHVAAAEKNLAAWVARRRLRQQTHNGLGGDGLTRAGFAHQRQCAALGKLERDSIDDRAPLAALRKRNRQLAHI